MAARKTKKKTTTKAVAKRKALSPLSLPDDLREEFSGAISRDRATAVSAGGWPMIRTSAQGFKLGLMDLGNPTDLIVLGAIRQNVLFEGDFRPGEPSLPTCAALDLEQDESTMKAPVAFAKAPTCAECSYNAWGSGKGRGRACKNQVKLAVFPYDPKIDYSKGGRGAIVNLPPTSLKPWSEYVRHVTDDIVRPLFTVVTRLETKPEAQGFSVTPSFGGPIDGAPVLRALAERAETDARKMLELLPPIAEDADLGSKPETSTGGVRRRKIQRKKK